MQRNPRSGVALLTEFRERELDYIRRRGKRANTMTHRENSNDETSFRASETFFYRWYTDGWCVVFESRVKTDFCAGSLVSADNETYCRR